MNSNLTNNKLSSLISGGSPHQTHFRCTTPSCRKLCPCQDLLSDLLPAMKNPPAETSHGLTCWCAPPAWGSFPHSCKAQATGHPHQGHLSWKVYSSFTLKFLIEPYLCYQNTEMVTGPITKLRQSISFSCLPRSSLHSQNSAKPWSAGSTSFANVDHPPISHTCKHVRGSGCTLLLPSTCGRSHHLCLIPGTLGIEVIFK